MNLKSLAKRRERAQEAFNRANTTLRIEIRAQARAGRRVKDLAADTGLSRQSIHAILRKES